MKTLKRIKTNDLKLLPSIYNKSLYVNKLHVRCLHIYANYSLHHWVKLKKSETKIGISLVK